MTNTKEDTIRMCIAAVATIAISLALNPPMNQEVKAQLVNYTDSVSLIQINLALGFEHQKRR